VFVVSYLIQATEAFISTVMSFETVVFVVSYPIQAIEAFIRTVMSFETVVFVVLYLILAIVLQQVMLFEILYFVIHLITYRDHIDLFLGLLLMNFATLDCPALILLVNIM